VARTDQGSTFYTYEDAPKSTIKQASNYSYAGSLAPATNKSEVSRYQFTGTEVNVNDNRETFANIDVNSLLKGALENDFNKKAKVGGANTFTIKGSTLVKNYTPGPGRTNILLDPDYAIGKVDFGTFAVDESMQTGPGTLLSSIPDTSRMQNTRILAVPHANPNKLVGEDNRNIAFYQVSQLKENPLSIYTSKPDGFIPNLYADNAPDNYSSMVVSNPGRREEELNKDFEKVRNNELNGQGSVAVYPKDDSVLTNESIENSNESVVYNKLGSAGIFNPLIEQGSSRTLNDDPLFSGKAYSGKFINDEKITIGGTNTGDEVAKVYGDPFKMEPRPYFAITESNGPEMKVPNKALKFADELVIDRDLQ